MKQGRMPKTYRYSSGIKHYVNHTNVAKVIFNNTLSRTVMNQSRTMISHYFSTLYQ